MRMRHESLYPGDKKPFSYSFQGCKKLFKYDSNASDAVFIVFATLCLR